MVAGADHSPLPASTADLHEYSAGVEAPAGALDGSGWVLEDDVGDLVCDVAVGPACLVERVVHHHRASAGRQPEGGAGEGVVLQVLPLLQPGTGDEFVCWAYLDAEMFGDGDGSYRFGRAQSHVGPDAQR